ncbi:hypothetical protein TELCIR_12796 [Teladorsagia circumcincta]|uniref:Uncharacterized protein n=1 Tax=Teladorsagia circumcincta TaxID=45464 RepID=A0A2G9U5J8_TELCI|nr:hypothetical protein TELCIR_12796 [Teladorsagia circumcincta]
MDDVDALVDQLIDTQVDPTALGTESIHGSVSSRTQDELPSNRHGVGKMVQQQRIIKPAKQSHNFDLDYQEDLESQVSVFGAALFFELDGLLYYHSGVIYEAGQSPLVGWLKPWMLPEILNVPVPEKGFFMPRAKFANHTAQRKNDLVIFIARPGAKRVLEINPGQIRIKPDVVRLPGCFTLEIKNLRVKDEAEAIGNSFFAKAEYQWWNVKDFSNLKCQNASNNGCGGYGNNWNSASMIGPPSIRMVTVKWIFYKETKGSVIAKIRLAFNATGSVERKRLLKEAQIEETVAKELEERRRTWDVNNGQFDKFSQWYIEYRKNIWHKDDYLPWLLYENEISCLKITFDVCEKPPRRINYGGRVRYTCEN